MKMGTFIRKIAFGKKFYLAFLTFVIFSSVAFMVSDALLTAGLDKLARIIKENTWIALVGRPRVIIISSPPNVSELMRFHTNIEAVERLIAREDFERIERALIATICFVFLGRIKPPEALGGSQANATFPEESALISKEIALIVTDGFPPTFRAEVSQLGRGECATTSGKLPVPPLTFEEVYAAYIAKPKLMTFAWRDLLSILKGRDGELRSELVVNACERGVYRMSTWLDVKVAVSYLDAAEAYGVDPEELKRLSTALLLQPRDPAKVCELAARYEELVRPYGFFPFSTCAFTNLALKLYHDTAAFTYAVLFSSTLACFAGMVAAVIMDLKRSEREYALLNLFSLSRGRVVLHVALPYALLAPTGVVIARILLNALTSHGFGVVALREVGVAVNIEVGWESFARALLLSFASALTATIVAYKRLAKIDLEKLLR